jgi:hypothetical protein
MPDLFPLDQIFCHVVSPQKSLRRCGLEFLRRHAQNASGSPLRRMIIALCECVRQYRSHEAVLLLCRAASDPAKASAFLLPEIATVWLTSHFGVDLLRVFVLVFSDKKLKAMMPDFPSVVEFLAGAMKSRNTQVFTVATAMFSLLPMDEVWGDRLDAFGVIRAIMERFPSLTRFEIVANAVDHIVVGYRSPIYEEFTAVLMKMVAENAPATPHCLMILASMCEYPEIAKEMIAKKAREVVAPLAKRVDVGDLARALIMRLDDL